MARTTKQLSGGGKDKLLYGLVAQVSDLPSDAVARVGKALSRSITEVRVRRDVWEDVRDGQAPAPKTTSTPAASVSEPAPVKVVAKPSHSPFDPFAFSAVAVFTRKGRDALVKALEEIEHAEDLRALAQAQHLAIEPALTTPADLRAAIVAGTERRIAERKAAAS